MPRFVKTPRDEHLWSKAKARAAAEGHTEDWAYITGIFKHMKGGNLEKSAAGHLGKVWSNIRGVVSGARLGGLQKHLIRREAQYRHIDNSIDQALDKILDNTKILHSARKQGVAPELIAKGEGEIMSQFKRRSEMIDKLVEVEPRKLKAQRLLAKFEGRANRIRNIGVGALAAGGAGAAGVHFYKKHKDLDFDLRVNLRKHKKALNEKRGNAINPEQDKTAEEGKKDVNWGKLLGLAAVTGAGMGLSKGFLEERIKRKMMAVLSKPRRFAIPFKKELPWAISRGITGGMGAAAGAGSMAVGLAASKNDKKKKS